MDRFLVVAILKPPSLFSPLHVLCWVRAAEEDRSAEVVGHTTYSRLQIDAFVTLSSVQEVDVAQNVPAFPGHIPSGLVILCRVEEVIDHCLPKEQRSLPVQADDPVPGHEGHISSCKRRQFWRVNHG